jgi:3-deoxy-D-manno-octulosonic acid (KDO) 8-phosphate synthase
VPVLSDVHQVSRSAPAAEVLDVLADSGFLCRRPTSSSRLAQRASRSNVKKGQFVAPAT